MSRFKYGAGMFSIISEKLAMALTLPRYEDAHIMAELANSEDIAENVGSVGEFPYPYTEQDAINAIDSAISSYELGMGYNFEVIPKDIDSPVGMAGIRNLNTYAKNAEMGFWTGKRYRGHGYTRAALLLLLGFCFKKLEMQRVFATALKSNEKSLMLMESLGMKKEGVLRNAAITKSGPQDLVLLSILNGEFSPRFDIVFKE
ncbi:MAG: GNAT family N-acetyltransferase [Candidatus Marsarchaeota archaeon]|jgi:RimJ/RimL family protein N-acetyltransferase|nr:GNAT family N-acetyltransferase [Candidatus Marsarchaeota archaeon]